LEKCLSSQAFGGLLPNYSGKSEGRTFGVVASCRGSLRAVEAGKSRSGNKKSYIP